MQSSLSSSSSSSSSATSINSTSLQSMISCKNFAKSMGAMSPQPRREIPRDEHASYRFSTSEHDTSTCSMRKIPAASRYGELMDCPHKSLIKKQCTRIVEEAQASDHGNLCKQAMSSQLSNGNISNSKSLTRTSSPLSPASDGNLDHTFEVNPNPKTYFKPSRTTPSLDANCAEHDPGRELQLEEGQGECNGDHVSSVNGSPSVRDNIFEDTNMVSWRKLSPAAASCFCKDIEEEQEYFQQVLGSSSHGWTDEKHSSYLNSMEADFLRSVMFKGTVPPAEPSPDLDDSASSHQAKATAEEFKICQSGRWRPVHVQAPYVNIGPLKQLAVAVKNPWIKRFRASRRAYFPSWIMQDPLLEEANARRKSQWRK